MGSYIDSQILIYQPGRQGIPANQFIMKYKILFILLAFFAFESCKSKTEVKNQTVNNTEIPVVVYPKPKVDIKTIGIFLYDGYTALDAMGPYEVFGGMIGTKVFFIGKHKGIIEDARGMKVQVDTSINKVKQLDILLMPGGLNETYLQTKDTALLSWIKAIDANTKYTTSVCTGAWILGAAGLLKDKEATTHWYGKKILAEEFGAKVQNTRYAKSGKYWTSAGITAGMDMSLALVNEIRGEKYTKFVMLNLEYNPQPPFKGGSEENTDKAIVEATRKAYEERLETIKNPENVFKHMHFDNKKDFSCGMPLTAGVGDTAQYKGKVYGFCSKECKDDFKKNPASYVATK